MEDSINTKALYEYIGNHSTEEDPVLAELRRVTFLKVIHPRMLSGHVQGRFLEMISRMLSPVNILEIGTYTGYSAICLARGLKPGGKLITLEINDELNDLSDEYFRKAGLEKQIERINGNALDILPSLKQKFDLAFIDGEKEQYIEYYQSILPKLNKNGVIIADNVLWDGKVLGEKNKRDSTTQAICDFNVFVQKDQSVDNLILPLRDGLMLIFRK